MGEVCISRKCKQKNAQFLLHKLHGCTGFSIIVQDDAHIHTVFSDIQLYKTDSCFSTKTQKTGNDHASLHKLYFGSTTGRFPANPLRVHHPPINTITPTFNLLICSPRCSPCLGSGSHPGGERCCKDEITGTSRSARPRIAGMTPFFAELHVPAIKIGNLHSNTQLHVASTQI